MLTRFASRKSLASNSVTSAALWLRKIEGSNRVTERTAERVLRTPFHNPSRVMPMGVMAPMPVIATRRFVLMMRCCGFRVDGVGPSTVDLLRTRYFVLLATCSAARANPSSVRDATP